LERARLAAHGLSGRVRIGVGKPALWSGLVARLIGTLNESHKDIELEIIEMEAPEQWRRLENRTLDRGVGMASPVQDRLHSEPVLNSPIDRALVAIDHPLAERAVLSPKLLTPYPLIGFQTGIHQALFSYFVTLLDAAGIRSEKQFNAPSMQSIWTLVAAGRGWTLSSSRWGERAPEGTVARPVRGLSIPFQYSMTSRRDEDRSHVLTVLGALRALRDLPPAKALELGQPAGGRNRRRGPGPAQQGIELRHLRYFVSLVDEGSFGLAAQQLRLTQPALSRQIRDLESAVGMPLVKRIPRGVRVTTAGEVLRGQADQLERLLDRLYSDLRAANRGMKRECLIGSVTTPITSRVIARAVRLLDEVHPSVMDVATPEQPELLRRGRIDIGICHAYPQLSSESELGHERLVDDLIECALLGKHHRLASRESLRAPDMIDVPFLFMPREFHPVFYDRVLSALRALNLEPKVEREYTGLHTVWSLAAQGGGWALGFRSHRQDPPENLVAVPVEGLSVQWGLDMMWRREDANPWVAPVVEAIRQTSRRENGQRS
jgi:DNA-binding transcriptional LysR family regulator